MHTSTIVLFCLATKKYNNTGNDSLLLLLHILGIKKKMLRARRKLVKLFVQDNITTEQKMNKDTW